MEFFKPNTQIDFLGLRGKAAIFSLIVFVASLISFFYHGLNLGLDFTGGTQMELAFNKPADLQQIRDELTKAGYSRAEVQSFGSSRSVIVTLAPKKTTKNAKSSEEEQKVVQETLVQNVQKALPDAKLNRAEFIGAKVSGELVYKGILAVVVALLATMIYIAFRFEYRLAVSAAISLIHDPVLILGVFSFFHIEFDLTSLAAVLTILGYSLHDSIVVFDRVRENFRKMRRGTPVHIVNAAVNQTLSRTVISSVLTFVVVAVLFLLGGPSIHAFAMALMVGIAIGTYSSIYVAGSLAVVLGLNRSDLLPSAKENYDTAP
ncbi:MAG: protein translocase subunit SecF [Pseudomonadota bacterium]|nr:protein translocase subunit SecF [Gammaproteobacteria bacterium]MBU1558424.1 protein translocase subunit SecF [Gammaproteobacteria bacterium]MBU1628949.1 protein translocase subunit SecF [Gammaproteobacteria bacterium]MBU1927185.1 protein translocase subunit SecF [Gammaproteobacteria bacterium]MBU2546384.1 protein translocase subunit SecF [Gammaproteobacteria bacterium]